MLLLFLSQQLHAVALVKSFTLFSCTVATVYHTLTYSTLVFPFFDLSVFLPSCWLRKKDGRFWKVPRQTNPNLLNKRPLKFACAYLNTQASSPSGTPLKRQQDG
ncbi:hypothetical protein T12_10200 [Trichinella patagoniensis]|uniref:Uncharacterized protein n=1 Tax=Trichinella patagoniensis TaxID=990121 RepID=A0A0V0ZHW1_9BILA|nr:hypothetical protein T12_10200 [Trichinella patagoniensis]